MMYENYLDKFDHLWLAKLAKWSKWTSPSQQVDWTAEQLADQCPDYGMLEITEKNGGPIHAIFRAMRMDLLREAKKLGIETPLADSLEGQISSFLHKLLPKLETPVQKEEVVAAINKTLENQKYFPITDQQLDDVETLTPWLVSAINLLYQNFPEHHRFNKFLVDVKYSEALSANNPLKKERGCYVLPRLYINPAMISPMWCVPLTNDKEGNHTLYGCNIEIAKSWLKSESPGSIIALLTHEMRHLQQLYLGVNLEVPGLEGKDLDFTDRPEDFMKAYKTAETHDPERYKLIRQAMEVDAEMYKAKIMDGIYSYKNGGYYKKAMAGTNQDNIGQPTIEQMKQAEVHLEQTMQPITLVESPVIIEGIRQRRVRVSRTDVPTRLEDLGYSPAEKFSYAEHTEKRRAEKTATPTMRSA